MKGGRIEMNKKTIKEIVVLGLVSLFLVVSFAVAEDSIGPYEPIADVNRDAAVDILDLVEVGQAYGSTYTPITQPNKTTITVFSYTSNFSYTPIADAFVWIFGHGNWETTNSSGVATFELGANGDYIAMAWSNDYASYNYANFTTNSLGEASVTIWLNHLPSPSMQPYPIQAYPKGWTVIVILDNNTNLPYTHQSEIVADWCNFTYWCTVETGCSMNYTQFYLGLFYNGFFAYYFPGTWWGRIYHAPSKDIFFRTRHSPWGGPTLYNVGTYNPDSYGGAYVIATINRYWGL